MKNDIKYIVVFDMDETLGHFEQLSIFWQILNNYFKIKNYKINKLDFFNLIDNFEKILRPKILNILDYLKQNKEKYICDKIIIYTNNPHREWCNLIGDYFNYKLQTNLFDQIIVAFKHHNRLIEHNRTRYDKSYGDLINCTKLSEKTQVCFLDDIRHPDMEHKNVVYLRVKPYVYSYPYEKMVTDYYNKNKDLIKDKKEFKEYMLENLNKFNYTIYNKSVLENKIDKLLSKRLQEHLESFFQNKKKKIFTI